MQYYKIGFNTTEQELKDVLIAILGELEYEGFEETEDALFAYIEEKKFDKDKLEEIAGQYGLSFDITSIPQQNWNISWEQNFQPVIVNGFCTVRADFHKIKVETPYEIVITPKMSFGTGHHATTQLVMTEMQHIDFKGKAVFDFGTGTGILAILSEMLGAKSVLAIDNDEWSYENVIENIERNHSTNITVKKGSIEDIGNYKYDMILANINRHILLHYMKMMYEKTEKDGNILMSGILTEDVEIVQKAAEKEGFLFVKRAELNNWVLLVFKR
jgi:ribosomal protein L11 methyltransferase